MFSKLLVSKIALLLCCALTPLTKAAVWQGDDLVDGSGQSKSIAVANQDLVVSNERDEVDDAIDRAIEFLLKQQGENGSFYQSSHSTTMSALGVMALASVGTTATQNDARSIAMRKALDFVLLEKQQNDEGYFGESDGSRMYGHGIITLMLSEMLGMGADQQQDALIQQRCQRGIDLILKSQRQKKPAAYQGGWRYTPDAKDSDLSISVWQVMALRSAKTDGMDIPNDSIGQAIAYFKRSCTSPLDAQGVPIQKEAGFSYTPGNNNIQFTMTAAGLLAMQVCGQYDSSLVEKSAEWLLEHPPKVGERFFYYGTYYYAQGMYQRGGKYANQSRKQVSDVLLGQQKADGSWAGQGEEAGAGPVYTTCLAILSLSVKYHYLPIYQK